MQSKRLEIDTTKNIIQFLSKTNERSPFELLFLYIRNNTTIPNFLASIKNELDKKEKTVNLLSAIQNGDSGAVIFNDKNCYLYLLFLIKEKEIPFWQGMNVYVYLMALMQFTNKQPLRNEDNDVKFKYEFSVDSLVQDNKLSPAGIFYIKGLHKRLEKINYKIDHQAIVDYILKLPLSDHWLFKVSKSRFRGTDDYSNFADTIFGNMPFIIECPETQGQDNHYFIGGSQQNFEYYWIPSVTIINYLLEKISSHPVKMQPIYGSINQKTLRQLHEMGIHPITTYAVDVKSNPYDTHKYRCGPFLAWLHDVAHAFMGNMLTLAERENFFFHLLPKLDAILEIANQHNDNELAEKILTGIDKINDFDLSPIFAFTNDQTRFISYIRRQLIGDRRDITLHQLIAEDKKIGELLDDRLIFLIVKLYYDQSSNPEDMTLWKHVLFNFYSLYRQPDIFKAVLTLAENASHSTNFNHELNDHDVNWNEWLKIIKFSQNSKEIWGKAKNERHDELLILITKYNISFFHPYLPMTEEKKLRFINFLEMKIQSENVINTPVNSTEIHFQLQK